MDEYDNFDYQYNYSQKSRLQRAGEFVWETLKVVVICLVIIIPVRYFLIQPFYVNGASMEPNFYDHEYLIIDEITYRFAEPERGDIVVFKYPEDPTKFFIKRVVALPGERVKIEDGKVYISKDASVNMELLQEDYLPEDMETALPLRGYSNIILAEDEYFLLGDNRDQSLDSRVFGPVERDFIIGRTWLRGWPFNRLTVFNNPEYNL